MNKTGIVLLLWLCCAMTAVADTLNVDTLAISPQGQKTTLFTTDQMCATCEIR